MQSYISLYAALVGTISLAWNIYNAQKDRGNILFTGHLRKSKSEMLDEYLNEIYLDFVNSGKRRIQLTDYGVKGKHNSFKPIRYGDALPKWLDPGENVEIILPYLSGLNVKSLYAIDSTGNKYKMKKKARKKLYIDINKLESASS